MAFRNWKQELLDRRPGRRSAWPRVFQAAGMLAVLLGVAAMSLLVWPGWLLPRPAGRPAPLTDALVIAFSSDARGYLEPCGCTVQRWGGIARLAGALRAAPPRPPVVMVDVGNMAAGPLRWHRIGLQSYLQALGELGYVAANVGLADAEMTADDLAELASSSPVPLISANLYRRPAAADHSATRPLLPSHRIVTVDNVRIAFVGVVEPDAARPPGPGLAIMHIDEALDDLLPRLRADCDILVLLASCTEPMLERLASAHPELDLILGGRVAQATAAIRTAGACQLAWHANRGQMLGWVRVPILPTGRSGPATLRMAVLDNDVPEDPAALALIARYNTDMRAIYHDHGLDGLGITLRPRPAGQNTYAGSASCRQCHVNASDAWEISSHSWAYATLQRVSRDHNPHCLSCHVVDLGAIDGFLGPTRSPQRMNVQCESCHGRAGDHVRARTQNLPANVGRIDARAARQRCQTCHDTHVHSPDFAFRPYWEQIKHGKD